jgi:hypothetical protein
MKKILSAFLVAGAIVVFNAVLIAQKRSGNDPSTLGANSELNRQAGILEAGDVVLDPNMPFRPLPEIRKELKEKIKVSDQDRDQLRNSVGDRKANIVRIVSSFSCSSSVVIDLSDPRCSENPDISVVSYYSFRSKEYGESAFTDISLSEGELSAGNKWHTVGILVDFGEAAEFSKLDGTSEYVKALWTMDGPETLSEKAKQKEALEKGIALGNLSLTSKLKIQLNHTYLVRSTSYRLEGMFMAGPIAGFGWNNTDSLFVIKVIAIAPDKTATIAWKRLLQRVAPLLKDKEKSK